MPTRHASRLVTVKVPGFTHDRDEAIGHPGWLTASFLLDDRRPQRIERGGELRTLRVDDDEDFIIVGFRAACARAAVPVPDALRCRAVSTIPIAAGRGASAAALLAGILGARALLDLPLDDAGLAHLACEVDAPADHVHAALTGHSLASHLTCDDD